MWRRIFVSWCICLHVDGGNFIDQGALLLLQLHLQTSFGKSCNLFGQHSIESAVVWYLHPKEEPLWTLVITLALLEWLMEVAVAVVVVVASYPSSWWDNLHQFPILQNAAASVCQIHLQSEMILFHPLCCTSSTLGSWLGKNSCETAINLGVTTASQKK